MMNNSTSASTSTSTSPPIDMTNATNSATYEAYLKQMAKPQTPAQIKAHGEVKTRIAILWFVGAICISLIVFGGISLIKDPGNAKDVWVIIGPILSSAITGTVAYFTGDKNIQK